MQEIIQKRLAKIREGNALSDPIITLGTVTKVIDARIGPKPVIKIGDGSIFKSFKFAANELATRAGYSKVQIRKWGTWTVKSKGSW